MADAHPKRIVCPTDVFYAIGKAHHIVGISGFTVRQRILTSAQEVVVRVVVRIVLLFQHEREHGMPVQYKGCAHDSRPATPLRDNHLRCALGQECRKCQYLAAIDRSEQMTPEATDEAKAWTCATHFLLESPPDVYFEQILRDKGDDAFDARLAESFGAEF